MKPRRIRWLRAALPLFLAATLATLLAATIYWTRFDAQWITFLGGVLTAGVLAMASQVSRAEWRVARRTRQLERERGKFEREAERSRRASDVIRALEARLRALGDAVASPVIVLDSDERCILHNQAVEAQTQLQGDKVHGSLLRDIVGSVTYEAMHPYITKSLLGNAASFPLQWDKPQGARASYSVRQIPFPPGPSPSGVCLVLSAAPQQGAASEPVPDEQRATLYVDAITADLDTWDDPRARLALAIEHDQFVLFEQKVLPLKPALAEQTCCEVLLRLQEEEDNLLPPGGFLPIAEHYGMMEKIDRWVVRHLISRCLERQNGDGGWRPPLYCVNLSAAALGSPGFARFVQKQLIDRGFDGRRLCFEIAEPDLIRQRDGAQHLISMLRPAGCRFTVDAFGTTGTPFAVIKGLPVDFIKIDGIIVQNILRSPAELAKVRAINIVSRSLGILTIAELVEDRATLDKLCEIGIDYAQGFVLAPPARMARAPAPAGS